MGPTAGPTLPDFCSVFTSGRRSLACCASASALLLGPATCDQCRDSAARAGGAPVGGACVLRHDTCRMFAMAEALPVAAACLLSTYSTERCEVHGESFSL